MRSLLRFLLALVLTIPLAAQQTPFAGAIAIPGTLQVENYDQGGEGIAWHDTTAGNAFGVYRFEDMDVGAIPGGGFHVGAIDPGEWAEYTVNITTSGAYTVTLRYASAYPFATSFRVLVNGVDVSGTQSVTSTGDWQAYTTKTFPVTLTAGASPQILRLNYESGSFNPDYLQFSTSCTTPTVTNPATVQTDPGTTVNFSVTTGGSPAPALQWFRNGIAIAGATNGTLQIVNAEQGKDGGSYTATVTNACGTRTSAAATLRVRCGNPVTPGQVAENINRALRGQTDYCDWTEKVDMSFGNNVFFGGSYNLPVVAGAVAYMRQPVKPGVWNMNTFWDNYLKGELGDRGAAWYYGGLEIGSYDYHHQNVVAVLAVHYWAHQNGDANIETLARRWLRATFALEALQAMPQQPLTLHAKGQVDTPNTNLTGPYVAVAGERSAWSWWMYPDRSVMFAHAAALATNGAGESPTQKNIRSFVESHWTGVFGLTGAEQASLAAAVNNATLIPNLKTSFLGANLRTHARYQIAAWPRVKAAVLEQSRNSNTTPTFGVAYFLDPKLASGREAHFLYPWSGLFVQGSSLFKNGVCTGTAFMDLSALLMQASHPNCPELGPNGLPKHPAETVTITGLPATRPNYTVTLDPNVAPSCSPTCP